MYEIKALIEKRAAIGAQADALLKANETRSMSAEDRQKFDAIMADFDSASKEIDAAKKLAETRAAQPSISDRLPAGEAEKRAMDQFLRRGINGVDSDLRSYLAFANDGEVRSVQVGSNVVGDRVFGGFVQKLKHYAGVIAAGATIETTNDGNPQVYLVSDDTGNTGEVLAEGTATSTTGTDPTEANVTLNALVYSSKFIKVSNQRLQDSAYDVIAAVEDMAAMRIGRKFNTDSTTAASNATATAKGIVAAAGTVAAAGATAITYADLVNLIHGVDFAYRRSPNCKLMLNDTTLAAVRKILDTTGRPIFDFQADTILGKSYVINNDMDATIASTKKSVLFGDFSKYVVRVVGTPTVKRAAERFVEYNETGFITFQRMDGALLDSGAVKALAH